VLTFRAPALFRRDWYHKCLIEEAGRIAFYVTHSQFFLGALLPFAVQLLLAKCFLPWFGATPAMWTTCMLLFQVVLLVAMLHQIGYGFIPALSGFLGGSFYRRNHSQCSGDCTA
jgi:hypothetical protein